MDRRVAVAAGLLGVVILIVAAASHVRVEIGGTSYELGGQSTSSAFAVADTARGGQPPARSAPPVATTAPVSTPPPATTTAPAATATTYPPTFVGAIATVNGGGVRFAYNDAAVGGLATSALDGVAATLPAGTTLVVRGHTDGIGDELGNIELGRRRAQAMADRLVAAGVAPARLVVMSVGDTEPIAGNETEAGRIANRRGEIAVGTAQ